ncbi:MAG: LamG domain-containing protein, partial [Planctomycetota bacterium]
YEDVVLFAGGNRSMTALSAETGQALWNAEHHRGGHNSPEDLLVVGGLVWSAKIAGGGDSGVWTGRDLRTGEINSEFLPDVETYWFHHRCHRVKATDKYLLPSRTGIEFVDFREQTWEIHHWVRGACLYGIMPCNGLIYAPQHPCACYPEAKLDGFNALAPASAGPRIPDEADVPPRLERGPAYGPLPPSTWSDADWPTYRGANDRSGYTKTAVPTELEQAWKTDLGEKLTSVVVAGGMLFTASVDSHTVHALDAASGEPRWSYTAGGRVDSPPTIYAGMALFGSADGYVYCLHAADGQFVWRFRAAPIDQRLVAFEQIESVWPVHGSVLVQDDVLFFAAGRNMFLDGGIWLYRLEPHTGRVLSITHMDDRHPDRDESLQVNVQILNMPVAKPDVLSSDGKRVYMKSQVFDLQGNRQELGPHSGEPAVQGWVQRGEDAHLFSPSSFLDDAFWHRTHWVYGRSFAGGHAGYSQAGKYAPAGRILVFDENNVYGYGRKPQYYRWTTPIEHHLWAADKEAPEVPRPGRRGESSRPPAGGARVCVENTPSLNPTGKPLAVEALVKAGKPDGVILARGGSRLGYALVLKDGRPCFLVRNNSELGTAWAEQKVPDGWVHLAGVLTQDKQLQVFVDGRLAATGKAPGLIGEDPNNPMEIGEDASSAVGDYAVPFSFTGLIDEVRVFHGTVEADEIARHCSTPSQKDAKDARLVLSMSFDAGEAKDDSGRGNHGRIEGAKPAEGKVGGALAFAALPGGPAKPAPKRPAAKTPAPAGQRGFHVAHHWSQDLPLMVRAMVQAGQTLFIAGPPDVLDEEEAAQGLGTPEIQTKLVEQDASLRGEKGGMLWAVSITDGAKLGQWQLDAPPAWDGMAAAGGRLYLTTIDGKVLCFRGP